MNVKVLLVIFVVTLFASQKLFTNSFYTSHDGGGHVIRMIEFDESLRDGQVPVRLTKRINHGLGYPFFNFNYPFIYYLSFLLHLIGLSFVTVFKVILVLSLFIGGVSMYFFARYYFDEIASLLAAIFYIAAPYRFLNMYVRGTVPESFALGILPLLFLSVERIVAKKRYGLTMFLIGASLLILSHNITALIAMPLVTLYFLFRVQTSKEKLWLIKQYMFTIVLSLLVTAFFWVPAIVENKLTKLVELAEDYRAFFPSLRDIIYSPWGFGAFEQGVAPGKMSPQIGIVHTAVSLIALSLLALRYVFCRGLKKHDRVFLLFITLSFVCFFLMSPLSFFLWEKVYFLQLVQHPWRLVGYVVLGASVAAGYIVNVIFSKRAKIFTFILLTILLFYANRNHIRVNQYIDFENPFEKAETYGPSTTSKDEHMPKRAPRIYEDPNPNGDIIASSSGTSPSTSLGTSRRVVWKSNYHLFDVNLKEDADFRDNTSYFPGWVAKVNGGDAKIDQERDEFYRLRVHLPAGTHKVEFFFRETWYRLLADIVSLGTVVGLVFYYAWSKRFSLVRNRRGKETTVTRKIKVE